jgi:pilus assembly protein CpaE
MLASIPDFVIATRTAGYREALQGARNLDLAIVLLDDEPSAGLDVIESLRRGGRSTHLVAVAPDDDPDTIVRTVRAGADEQLALPLSQHDLFKVCIKVAEACRDDAPGGELWVIHGPKGGVGATTVTVNLAVALQTARRDVALVDLDVYAGDAAFFLNVQPSNTLRDVVTNYDRLDAVLVQGATMRLPSGLSILASRGTARGEPPLEPTMQQTTDVLELVTGMHELTVVNTPRILSPATRAALLAADRIFLVTDLTVPALRSCARTVDWLAGEEIDIAETVEVIVNRYNARSSAEVSTTDVARMMRAPVRASLPCDDAAALTAANAGRPLADDTALQRAIAEIASPGGAPAGTGRIKRGLARLFSSNPA